jgi:hypothetical protein
MHLCARSAITARDFKTLENDCRRYRTGGDTALAENVLTQRDYATLQRDLNQERGERGRLRKERDTAVQYVKNI